ncbi:MAG: beta strand repeat-containing protein, partial [Dolichospermum sp.]
LTSTGLGIGTSSPTVKLDVNGAGNFTGSVTTSSSNGYNVQVSGGNAYRMYATVNDLVFRSVTAGSDIMTLTYGGNLGLGTSAPDRKLVIQGAFNSNEQLLYLKQGDNNGFSFNLDAAVTGNLMIKGVNSGTETSSLLTIRRDNGNTGIGTSAPAEKLDVYDNSASNVSIKVGNTSGALQLLQGNGAAYLYTATNQPLIFSNNNSEKMRLDASGNLYLNTTSGTGRLVIAQSNATQPAITLTTDESTIQGPSANTKILMGGNLSMYGANILTFGTGTTERARIDASGNLGLGTTSTSAISGGYTGLFINGSSGSNIDFRAGETGYGRVQADVNGLLFAGLNSVPITFFTSGSERMRITSGGSVGIGTTSPTAKTHIEGANDLLLLKMTSGGYNALTLSTTFVGGNNYIINPYITGVSNGGFEIKDLTNNASRIVIAPSTGNVGIGTTSPTQKLDVNGTIQGNNGFNGLSGATHNLLIDWSAESQVTTLTATNLFFGTNAERRMTITSGGNVGIGTTSPTYKLDITGGFADGTNNYIATFHSNTGTTGDAYIGIGAYRSDALGSGRNAYINAVAASGGSGALLLQTSGGNVGIGTTSPNSYTGYTTLTINNGTTGSVLDLDVADVRTATVAATASAFYLSSETNIPLIMQTNGSERMRITSGGEVLVGSTSSGLSSSGRGVIEINGTSESILGLKVNNVVKTYLYQSGDNVEFNNTANGYLALKTNASERMRITSSGELLINTTSDAGDYKLQVNGNIYANGVIRSDNAYVQIVNSSNPSLYLSNNTIQWQIYNNSSNELVFKDGSYD